MLRKGDMVDAREVFDAADLGGAIRALRRERGWTQAELAGWLNVHRVTVARLEQGRPVAVTVALRALSMLGCKAIVVPKTVPSSGLATDANRA